MTETLLLPVKQWQALPPKKSANKETEKAKPIVVKKWQNRTTGAARNREIVLLLLTALQNDFSVSEACRHAGIGRTAFYHWIEEDPKFAEEVDRAKEFPKLAAKNKMMNIINKGSDRDAGPMVRWFLERKVPQEYGQQQILPGNTQNNYFFVKDEQLRNISPAGSASGMGKNIFGKAAAMLEGRMVQSAGDKGSSMALDQNKSQS